MKTKTWKSLYSVRTPYDNGAGNLLTAYVPEFWARESLMVLVEELVAANLVYRDFSNEIASFGDTVNTRLPGDFIAKRKTDIDDVTIQDAIATNVQVVLNQHIHVSFMIKDGQESLAMEDLVETFIRPAMRANGNIVDKIILAQFAQFLLQSYGTLGTFDSTNAKDRFLNVRRIFNSKSVPEENRNFVLTVNSETAVLATDLFLQAQQVGDDGTALREASLGRKFGLNTFKSVFMPSLIEGNTTKNTTAGTLGVGAINNASGYPLGTATALTVDGFTGVVTVGEWLKVAGVPYRVAVTSATLGATTSITLDRPLIADVVDNAVIIAYKVGAVNQAVSPTGYAAGYSQYIAYDGTVTAQRGQMVSFGVGVPTYVEGPTGGPAVSPDIYVIVDTDGSSSIMLDRPLTAAIADNAVINFGPGGEYNFAFMRNAIALVTRPLSPPKAGVGALSAIASYNGLSMRAVITYDGRKQGHLVTLDMLLGIKVLDDRMGVVVYG